MKNFFASIFFAWCDWVESEYPHVIFMRVFMTILIILLFPIITYFVIKYELYNYL